MSPEDKLFWFQLVNSDDGLPYKGTSFSSILRSSLPFSIVDHFRKAVKAEYADSHLKGIAPSNLLVYENIAAFSKRNATENEGKVAPLEVDFVINGLGKSKKGALVVP